MDLGTKPAYVFSNDYGNSK